MAKQKDFSLRTMRARDLTVNDRIQRGIEQAHVKRLARDWDDALVGVLTVSHRQGRYYIVDGQQRHHAQLVILNQPDYLFDCAVYENLTEEDEGRKFLAMNRDHKGVSTYDRYRVAVNIGEPLEASVDDAVTSLGYSVGRKSSRNVLGIPGTLMRMHQQLGKPVLMESIILSAEVFRDDADPWNATVVEGLGLFLHKYGAVIDRDRLIAQLREKESWELVKAARLRVEATASGKRRTVNQNNRPVGQMREVIVDLYDGNRRKNLLREVEAAA